MRSFRLWAGDPLFALGALACIVVAVEACYLILREHGVPASEALALNSPVENQQAYAGQAFAALSSFRCETPEPGEPPDLAHMAIPAHISALSGKRVTVQGFMIPTNLKNGITTRFMLIKYQWGRYDRYPRLNEWIAVQVKPGVIVHNVSDRPIVVVGTFDVGARIENGEVQSLYRLEADGVMEPSDL